MDKRVNDRCCLAVAIVFLGVAYADPVPVRHVEGFLHGYIVLKNTGGKILAAGDLTQTPAGNLITTVLTLHFGDGSLYQETPVYSQQKVFRLLSYKQIQKGPSFKAPQTLSFDTSGKVTVEYEEKGKRKTLHDQMALPPDIANGIIPMLLTQIDSKAETTLSMLVPTPKPRLVKLKISAAGQDLFFIGARGAKATHYVARIDIGGVTGAVAKIVGKQPPPIHFWIAAGNSPAFLKSEGPLYEDGPIWRIELASPTWLLVPI
ncbi:MAG: hypothetical protein ACREA1_00660 [Nitrosotalea sp.]